MKLKQRYRHHKWEYISSLDAHKECWCPLLFNRHQVCINCGKIDCLGFQENISFFQLFIRDKDCIDKTHWWGIKRK